MPKRKAANNDGSLFRRKDGLWVGVVTVGTVDGRRVRKSIYRRTQKEARKALTRLRADLDNGKRIRTDERETVGAFLAAWLEVVRPTVGPRTWQMYELHVRRHIAPHLGGLRLSALTTDQVQIALNRISAAGLSPQSVRHIRATLRMALNAGIEWDRIDRNPAARGVKLPPMAKREVSVLSEDEARRLLETARDEKLFALWAAALGLGLRLGESLGLTWDDIDLDAGVVHVRRSLQRFDGRLQLVPTKTKGSTATLRMPEVVAAAMRGHRARQELDRRLAGEAWHETGLVFTTNIGTALEPRSIQRQFGELLDRAGLRRITFHTLRHSFASILLARGATFHEVAQLLRHSSPALVASTYGHVMPHRPQQVIGEMDLALGGARQR